MVIPLNNLYSAAQVLHLVHCPRQNMVKLFEPKPNILHRSATHAETDHQTAMKTAIIAHMSYYDILWMSLWQANRSPYCHASLWIHAHDSLQGQRLKVLPASALKTWNLQTGLTWTATGQGHVAFKTHVPWQFQLSQAIWPSLCHTEPYKNHSKQHPAAGDTCQVTSRWRVCDDLWNPEKKSSRAKHVGRLEV